MSRASTGTFRLDGGDVVASPGQQRVDGNTCLLSKRLYKRIASRCTQGLSATGKATGIEKSGLNEAKTSGIRILFYRIVTSWSVESLGKTANSILAPIQLGITDRGGVEKASIFIQTLLTDDNLKFSGVATDISNAYNNRERKTMLDALYAHWDLRRIWRLADWAYTSPTPLWLKSPDGEIRECIPSSNGVRQGCGNNRYISPTPPDGGSFGNAHFGAFSIV